MRQCARQGKKWACFLYPYDEIMNEELFETQTNQELSHVCGVQTLTVTGGRSLDHNPALGSHDIKYYRTIWK